MVKQKFFLLYFLVCLQMASTDIYKWSVSMRRSLVKNSKILYARQFFPPPFAMPSQQEW